VGEVHQQTAATGKREATKIANRKSIVEAGRLVFAELGYGTTTVRDIIRRTGLASGTFYNYFNSKEEVFQAIMDESALTVRPRLLEERAKAQNFEEFLHGMLKVFFEYALDDHRAYQMMRANTGAIRVRMDTPEVIAGFEELESDIERGIALGVVPNVDASYLSAALIGIAFEMADRLVQRDNADPEEAARFATALLIGGIPRVAENS